MIISLIAAMSEERVIGRAGQLPWNIPADLTRFKNITMGHALVMGRKTFESIGHPLPGRRNIVLSRTLKNVEGCEVARSLQEAIEAAEGDEEIFICGGEQVFRDALPLCQRMYLTIIHASFAGDTRFPEIPAGFHESSREERADLTPPLSFVILEKTELVQPESSPQDLRKKGREAIQRQLYFLARTCLTQALALEEDAGARSDLAFCIAKSGGDLDEAVRFAEQAAAYRPDDPSLQLNLGRILIMHGDRERGIDALRKGVQVGGGAELQAELEKLGVRKPPPIGSLQRSHPLNKFLGLLLSRLGLR